MGIPALRSKSILIPALPVPALPQTPPPEIQAFPPFHAIPALHLGLNPVPALPRVAEETMFVSQSFSTETNTRASIFVAPSAPESVQNHYFL